MAYLEEIYQYKEKILPLLFNSPTIVATIDNKEIDPNCPDQLIYKNLFTELYIPETPINVATYICFDLYALDITGDLYKNIELHFYIFSHQDHMRTSKGYSRPDYIQSEIDKIMNGNQNFGIGKLELKRSIPFYATNVYRGRELIYKVLNFNQDRRGGFDKY